MPRNQLFFARFIAALLILGCLTSCGDQTGTSLTADRVTTPEGKPLYVGLLHGGGIESGRSELRFHYSYDNDGDHFGHTHTDEMRFSDLDVPSFFSPGDERTMTFSGYFDSEIFDEDESLLQLSFIGAFTTLKKGPFY